jgi:peptidoglycan/xylan/chitin deacetylase (PgdA/CDA1 family)
VKHRLKLLLRAAVARFLWHTGLYRLVDRVAPRRLTILAGHCVDEPALNGGLPGDMKISAGRLEALLRGLSGHFEFVTVGAGVAALDAPAGRSMVALSMDDGYRDNRTALLPLLARTGARATVYLESRPLLEQRVNWSHKYFWLLDEGGLDAGELGRRYLAEARDTGSRGRLEAALISVGEQAYLVKRVFKYDAPPDERDRILDALFLAQGGDEAALCERIYMDLEDARALQAAGVELGGHTQSHEVLATLPAERQRVEVGGARAALERALGPASGVSFAYPFGRRWDHDEASAQAVREAGFASAVTTHAGTNTRASDRLHLARWMIDEETPLHLLAAEACGAFLLLRRLGLDLSE